MYRKSLANQGLYKKKLDTNQDTHSIKIGVQLWCECSYRIWQNTVLPIVEHHIQTIIRTFAILLCFSYNELTKNQGGFNMKTIFENSGGAYTQVGDYLLPNLSLPAEEKETNIGVWAMRHKRYLKQNYKVRYYNLLTSGKLNSYLADIDKRARFLFDKTVKSLAEKESVTEKLKSENAMLWVQKMNNIRNRATEIVNEQVIYN